LGRSNADVAVLCQIVRFNHWLLHLSVAVAKVLKKS